MEQKTVKAKCIAEDPLQWVQVGKTYECNILNKYNVLILEKKHRFAISKETFKELFQIIDE